MLCYNIQTNKLYSFLYGFPGSLSCNTDCPLLRKAKSGCSCWCDYWLNQSLSHLRAAAKWPMKSWHFVGRAVPSLTEANNVSVRFWTRECVENYSFWCERRMTHSCQDKHSMVKRELRYLELPWFFTTFLTVNDSLRWSKETPISCNQESLLVPCCLVWYPDLQHWHQTLEFH